MELTARFPSYLPVPIATSTEWNAWLTKEADGQDLFNRMEITAWRRAAESLADLEIASIQHTSDILAAGALDKSIALGGVKPFHNTLFSHY